MIESAVGLPQPAFLSLPATEAHAATAPRAIQHLIAREQAQAEALQSALLTGTGATNAIDPQLDFRNVILSTSFGGQSVNATPAQSNPQGSVNVTSPASPMPTTGGVTISTQPVPSAPVVGVSLAPPPAVSASPPGALISPISPPVTHPSLGSIGPIGSPSLSLPIPQSTQLPSLPSLLGTLDVLQLDKGKSFKDKPDKLERSVPGSRR